MGVCHYPQNGNYYDSLVNQADNCLYIAENMGKNRYISYDPDKHGHFLDEIGRKGFSMTRIKKGEVLSQEVAGIAIDLVQNAALGRRNVTSKGY